MDINWEEAGSVASQVVTALAPLVEAAVPGAAPGIAIGAKIVQGLIAGAPRALALVEQIKAGQPLTPDQLKALDDEYDSDWKDLHDDIAAQLKADGQA